MMLDITNVFKNHGWFESSDCTFHQSFSYVDIACTVSEDESKLKINISRENAVMMNFDIKAKKMKLLKIVNKFIEQIPNINALQHREFISEIMPAADDIVIENTDRSIVRPKELNNDLI